MRNPIRSEFIDQFVVEKAQEEGILGNKRAEILVGKKSSSWSGRRSKRGGFYKVSHDVWKLTQESGKVFLERMKDEESEE